MSADVERRAAEERLLREEVGELVRDPGAHPHPQRGPAEPSRCFETPQAAHENPCRCDRDGLEEPDLLDRLGKGVDVAEVRAVTYADDDRVDGALELDVAFGSRPGDSTGAWPGPGCVRHWLALPGWVRSG